MQQKELLWWLADRASEKLEEIWSVLYTRLTNNDGAKKEVQHNVWTLCCHHFADFESDSQIGHLPCVLLLFFYRYHVGLLITWECPFCLDTKSLVRKVLLLNHYNEQSIHKNSKWYNGLQACLADQLRRRNDRSSQPCATSKITKSISHICKKNVRIQYQFNIAEY